MTERTLTVEDLSIDFVKGGTINRAIDSLSLHIEPGEILGVVGRSGAGKSVLTSALANSVEPPGLIASGKVWVGNTDLLTLSEAELRPIRGKVVASIVSHPRANLNPVLSIGVQLGNVYQAHHKATRRETRERVLQMLHSVGMPAPKDRYDAYAHQLSGGMAQRCLVALALISGPSVLLADEPTSGLDVTIQDQILRLIQARAKEQDAACLLVTRDMGIVANFCDRVAVLDKGRIVETARTREFFEDAQCDISRQLIAASSYRTTWSSHD